MSTASMAAPMTRAETTALAGLALSQVILFLVPLVVLGQAIGWPASLRLPAAEALPLVHRNALAVQIGYWGYLVTVLAMVPFVLALRRLAQAHGVTGLLTDTMAAFGLLAAVLKSLGIVRWLIAMPDLARMHASATEPALRTVIEATYAALNGYAGSVGELLGVQLFSGVWLILLGLILGRAGLRLNALASAIIGLGFALTALRSAFPALNLLGAVVPPAALLWLLVLAATFWGRRQRA
jgi:hypothetical protein